MARRTLILMVLVALVTTTVGAVAGADDEKATLCFGRVPTHSWSGGDDVIVGTPFTDVLYGGGGNDLIFGGGGNDFICGGKGHDEMYGEGGGDKMKGQGGNDLIDGGAGKDKLFGNGGHDDLFGGNKRDVIKGGGGDDFLYGEGGNDRLLGQAGNDTLIGTPGIDEDDGGSGNDWCDPLDDAFFSCESIGGGGGGGANSFDWSLAPAFGTKNLSPGFSPDPKSWSVVSGGPVDATYLGGDCRGYGAEAPDISIQWTGGGFLRFFFLPDVSGDTGLVINDPFGNWHCNDDSWFGLNPTVDFVVSDAGRYDIWITSFNPNTFVNGRLYVTEFLGVHP